MSFSQCINLRPGESATGDSLQNFGVRQKSLYVRNALKAEEKLEHCVCRERPIAVDGVALFNKIKQRRRIATRYDKLAANYLAFIKARINPHLAAR